MLRFILTEAALGSGTNDIPLTVSTYDVFSYREKPSNITYTGRSIIFLNKELVSLIFRLDVVSSLSTNVAAQNSEDSPASDIFLDIQSSDDNLMLFKLSWNIEWGKVMVL